MKFLIISLLCAKVFAQKIGVPRITSVTALDPPGFFIKWSIVTRSSRNRILGYKIKIWKVMEDEQGYFNLVNGEQIPGLLLNKRAIEPLDKNNPPKSEPRVVLINNIVTDKARIYDVNSDALYEIRILAYREDVDGEMSDPVRVKIMKADAYHVFVKKNVDNVCEVSVATNVTISGDEYYHVETLTL